jgi:hypothetical protein
MPWPSELPIDTATTGENVLVAAEVGQIIQVWQLFVVVDADTVLTVRSGVGGTDLTGPMAMKANGAIVLDPVGDHRDPSRPWFTTGPGEAFVIDQSGSAQLSGRLYYSQGMP